MDTSNAPAFKSEEMAQLCQKMCSETLLQGTVPGWGKWNRRKESPDSEGNSRKGKVGPIEAAYS